MSQKNFETKEFCTFGYRLLFFESDYHDSVEEAQEVKPTDETKEESVNNGKDDEKLLDIGDDSTTASADKPLSLHQLNLNGESGKKEKGLESLLNDSTDKEFDDFFKYLGDEKAVNNSETPLDQIKLDESLTQLDLAMDSFTGSGGGFDFTNSPLFNNQQQQSQPPLDLLTSESVALFEEILNTGPSSSNNDWEMMSGDTFLPPGILKQSLGAATLGNHKDSVSAKVGI